MNIMKYRCMCLDNGLCRVESSRQPFWILVDKKIVSVGKEHTTYVIFPINSWEFPPVETFFDMDFSGNNPANYNLQGYSKSETHSTREAKTVESKTLVRRL